jgi:integrase
MSNSLKEIVKELREIFPNLSDIELAELALGQTHGKKNVGVTVSDLLVKIRKTYWDNELKRLRAKKKPDGTMNLKDTSTFRVYDTNWKRLEALFGQKDIADLKASDVVEVALLAEKECIEYWEEVNKSRELRGLPLKEFTGANRYNACLDAISVVFNKAVEQELIPANRTHSIPRKEIDSPKRHGLTKNQVEELLETALSGGNDPILDHLILWTQLETAARMGGILKLQLRDLDTQRQSITLVEKRSKKREQPVTKELMESLIRFAKSRGAEQLSDSVFRFLPNKNGVSSPLSSKRFETLWKRMGKSLPWVSAQGISGHYLRHTVLTWVDRTSGHSVARAYAGHSAGDTTDSYTKVGFAEIVNAHSSITGSLHPLQMENE